MLTDAELKQAAMKTLRTKRVQQLRFATKHKSVNVIQVSTKVL